MEIKNYADLLKVHTYFEDLLAKDTNAESAKAATVAAARRHAALEKRAEVGETALRETLARLKARKNPFSAPPAKARKSARSARPK